jgi:chromosome segregation ATPase
VATDTRAELKATITLLEQDCGESGLGTAELRERFAASDLEVEAAKTELEELRLKLAELGPANLGALEEYQALCQRYEFLTTQAEDLTRSVTSLRQAIGEINKTIQTLFNSTLEAVNQQFDHFWRRLIGGGSAQLKLVEPTEPDGDAGPEAQVALEGALVDLHGLLRSSPSAPQDIRQRLVVHFPHDHVAEIAGDREPQAAAAALLVPGQGRCEVLVARPGIHAETV